VVQAHGQAPHIQHRVQAPGRSGVSRRLQGLSKRNDVCRYLIRVWVQKHQAGAFDDEVGTANLLQQYEARIAALERLVGKHVPGAFHFFDVQRKQPQSVKKELAALSSREAEYNRLSQDLTLAVTAAQSYAKRTTEEWINTRFANARLSGLRITQLASPPDFPAFPQPIIFLALGLVGGIVLASAALLPEALACVGTYDAVSRGSA
jgi:hypothetical protein